MEDHFTDLFEHDNQTSEDRLHYIMEASNDGFWEWSKTAPLFMSARCKEILGFTPENFTPLPQIWLERIHPQDIEHVKQTLQDHIQGITPYFFSEYRFCSGSGDWKWIQSKARILLGEAGRPWRIAGSVSDISIRKNTELTLQESESLYRSLVETSPNAIVLTDVNGVILFINRQGAEMSEWNDSTQLLGKSARILFSPQDWERVSRDYMRAMTSGGLNNLEYTCICRSGSQFIIELSAAPIYDAANQLRGCLTTAQDITQRKQMERELLQHRIHLQKLVEEHTVALRLSEEKFTKAFRANPTSMSITTLKEGTYIDVNDAFCYMVGYKKAELIGQPSVKIWAKPDDRALYKKLIEAHGYVKDFELYFYSRSGEVRIGLLSGQRIQIGDGIYILSSMIDVTEQRMMDREIARLDRLNLIGEMAASIGHEIRNPMTTVRGLLQILGEDDAYQKDRELFDLMIEELDRANSIISEFLSLAKDKIVELLPCNLSAAATSVIPLIQANATAQDKKLSVHFSTVPDILLDQKEIRQLLLNLSQNGLEAMEPGGTLTLKIYEEHDKVVLAVQDQGKGVDPHVMDKLGMPFVTTKDQGTGLGLSVCYRIAARHNANIEVESNPQGSIFYVNFPIK